MNSPQPGHTWFSQHTGSPTSPRRSEGARTGVPAGLDWWAHRLCRRGHFRDFRRSARAACGWVTVCGWPVLIMLFMRFPLPGCFAADGLFVPSCSRRDDQEGSHGVERRDIEAFRADVDLVQPRRGVTSASLDRGHVEGGGDGDTHPPSGVHRAVVRPQVLDHHRSIHTRRPITARWSGAPAKDPPSRTFAAPRCEHYSGLYAPALRIVTIYSAPTRMPSLRARRMH
jgi:hypothetical protein